MNPLAQRLLVNSTDEHFANSGMRISRARSVSTTGQHQTLVEPQQTKDRSVSEAVTPTHLSREDELLNRLQQLHDELCNLDECIATGERTTNPAQPNYHQKLHIITKMQRRRDWVAENIELTTAQLQRLTTHEPEAGVAVEPEPEPDDASKLLANLRALHDALYALDEKIGILSAAPQKRRSFFKRRDKSRKRADSFALPETEEATQALLGRLMARRTEIVNAIVFTTDQLQATHSSSAPEPSEPIEVPADTWNILAEFNKLDASTNDEIQPPFNAEQPQPQPQPTNPPPHSPQFTVQELPREIIAEHHHHVSQEHRTEADEAYPYPTTPSVPTSPESQLHDIVGSNPFEDESVSSETGATKPISTPLELNSAFHSDSLTQEGSSGGGSNPFENVIDPIVVGAHETTDGLGRFEDQQTNPFDEPEEQPPLKREQSSTPPNQPIPIVSNDRVFSNDQGASSFEQANGISISLDVDDPEPDPFDSEAWAEQVRRDEEKARAERARQRQRVKEEQELERAAQRQKSRQLEQEWRAKADQRALGDANSRSVGPAPPPGPPPSSYSSPRLSPAHLPTPQPPAQPPPPPYAPPNARGPVVVESPLESTRKAQEKFNWSANSRIFNIQVGPGPIGMKLGANLTLLEAMPLADGTLSPVKVF
eukprot:c18395_g1_i2.p1 GENE.c18395_g1_i2~~c18395_g1_i2.p1  ORF type:complete len:664 (+),score=128.04 c18395_g1_i2:32-1993(+)